MINYGNQVAEIKLNSFLWARNVTPKIKTQIYHILVKSTITCTADTRQKLWQNKIQRKWIFGDRIRSPFIYSYINDTDYIINTDCTNSNVYSFADDTVLIYFGNERDFFLNNKQGNKQN